MAPDEFPLTVSAGRQSCLVQHPDRLLSLFEGLGANCEFGNVQRASGFEPLGLFRFASLPYEHMLGLLRTRFKGVDDPDLIGVRVMFDEHDEWWGTIDTFGIRYHTHRSSSVVPRETALADERLKMRYLKRKLLDDLDEPTKIFVRSDLDRTIEEMLTGFEALKSYGDHTLLWTLEAPERHLIGTVRSLAPGLVLGYLDKLDPHAVPSLKSVSIWHRLLYDAVDLLRPDLAADIKRSENNLPHGAITTGQLWHAKANAHSTISVGVAPRLADAPVLKHVLLREMTFPEHIVLSCGPCDLQSGATYVFSMWIWIPRAFEGKIDVVFPGSAALWNFGVDMKARERWQRVVSSIRLPADLQHHYPSLVAEGAAGQSFYSTEWRFERGVIPDRDGLEDAVLSQRLPERIVQDAA